MDLLRGAERRSNLQRHDAVAATELSLVGDWPVASLFAILAMAHQSSNVMRLDSLLSI